MRFRQILCFRASNSRAITTTGVHGGEAAIRSAGCGDGQLPPIVKGAGQRNLGGIGFDISMPKDVPLAFQ